ncbi:MAG: glycosyltransferase family 4 protein, partial [Aggregatilineales bacterium]
HYYPTLKQHLREFQPDIVHIDEEPYNLSTWQLLRLAKQHNTKSLIFTWQNILRKYPPPFSWGETWTLNNIDYLLAGTDSAGDIMRQKGYAGEIATIPQFGTDPDLFKPVTTRPKRPFTIGYIGRLVEEKGVQDILQAAGQLKGDWHLRLVGSGPLKETLMQQAETLNIAERITWIDWIASTEMPSQYHQVDVLILPSLTRPNWKEQFGRVLVEAMASGVPLIGSDSGAIPGVMGDGGLVIPEGDVDALLDALQRLHDDTNLRKMLAKNGRKRALVHFTHQSIAQATVSVYQKML